MKKIFKMMIVLAMVLTTTFAFAGCKIVQAEGEWVCTKMTLTNSYSYGVAKTDLMQHGGDMTIVLDEDGSMTIDLYAPVSGLADPNYQDSGKWTLDGTTIKLDGQEKDIVVEWDNNKLTYTIEIPLYDDERTATNYVTCELVKKAV